VVASAINRTNGWQLRRGLETVRAGIASQALACSSARPGSVGSDAHPAQHDHQVTAVPAPGVEVSPRRQGVSAAAGVQRAGTCRAAAEPDRGTGLVTMSRSLPSTRSVSRCIRLIRTSPAIGGVHSRGGPRAIPAKAQRADPDECPCLT
jgi:hypothetical protein